MKIWDSVYIYTVRQRKWLERTPRSPTSYQRPDKCEFPFYKIWHQASIGNWKWKMIIPSLSDRPDINVHFAALRLLSNRHLPDRRFLLNNSKLCHYPSISPRKGWKVAEVNHSCLPLLPYKYPLFCIHLCASYYKS